MNEKKKDLIKATKKELTDAKGGIPYEKPRLVDPNIAVALGDCDDGGFNIGFDAECTSGNKNIDLGPPPDK